MMGEASGAGSTDRRPGEGEHHDTRLVPGRLDAGSVQAPAARGLTVGRPDDTVIDLVNPVLGGSCANCGRPVPQPGGDNRLVRYCQDTDGACARAAHDRAERGGAAPGLTGDVARAWQLVERMERMAGTLADSLTCELGVAGVERRVARANAEAATCVAVAQEEREAAERKADTAWREASSARARAEAASRDAAEARARAERAEDARAAAEQACADARASADRERAGRLAADSERDRVASREGELLAALEAARAELVELHSRLAQTEAALETRQVEADTARQSADDIRQAMRGGQAQLQRAIDERGEALTTLREQEQQTWNLSRSITELQNVVSTLTAERDAARAEAERARRRVDDLTAADAATPPAVARPPRSPGPPVSPGSSPVPPPPRAGDGSARSSAGWNQDDPLFGLPGPRPDGPGAAGRPNGHGAMTGPDESTGPAGSAGHGAANGRTNERTNERGAANGRTDGRTAGRGAVSGPLGHNGTYNGRGTPERRGRTDSGDDRSPG